MSTIDPDARARALGARFQYLALPACLIGIGAGPVLAFIVWVTGAPDSIAAWVLLGFPLICTAVGLLILTLPNRPGSLAIGAYCFAYLGGLFLIMATGASFDPTTPLWSYLLPVIAYAIAITLAVLQRLRTLAVKVTSEHGIDTTGVITGAGIDGMVNYVQHQRLTVKFTDDKGIARWVRIGRTGGGYSVGDKLPVRYDPDRPWSKRSIVIGN